MPIFCMVVHAILHLISYFFTLHLFLGGPPSYPTLVAVGGGDDVGLTKRRGTGGNRTQSVCVGGGGGNYTNATQSPPEWFCINSGVSHLPLIVRGKVTRQHFIDKHRQPHHFPFHLAFITSTVYLNVNSSVQCCFTATETTGLNRIREPLDGHLDFHTTPELWWGVTSKHGA